MTYPWGDTRRFNSYAGYFRRLFGCRVQKLSVDAGFTCPNRDGTIGELSLIHISEPTRPY